MKNVAEGIPTDVGRVQTHLRNVILNIFRLIVVRHLQYNQNLPIGIKVNIDNWDHLMTFAKCHLVFLSKPGLEIRPRVGK